MPRFTAVDALEILIVSFVVYRFMLLIRGTRATAIIKGLTVLFLASGASRLFGLPTVSWLLQTATTAVLVALPIVFYPELRRALEHLGRRNLFRAFSDLNDEQTEQMIDHIVRAVRRMASDRQGALIAIERDMGLEEYIETGVRLDAVVDAELLVTIFQPSTPLHDGAVILQRGRLAAAGCFLPLSNNSGFDAELGTRHRAAIGLSEQSDAYIIVVSEERGTISLAADSTLHRAVTDEQLRQRLRDVLGAESTFVFKRANAG